MGNTKQCRVDINRIHYTNQHIMQSDEGFFTIEQITEITIYNGSCNKIKIHRNIQQD